MIINQVCIRSFGKLNNINATLGKNVNIINGDNEAGKSTFCNFIKFAFYGTYGTKDDRFKYISWYTNKASGYIEITLEDGKQYRIDRDVTLVTKEDGSTKVSSACAVYDLFTHEKVFNGLVPGEVFFGVNLEIFENTIFVRQLEDNKVGGKSLALTVENMLFSGDENVSVKNALKALDEVRVDLLYKNEKGGKIYDYKQKTIELENKLEEAQNNSTDLINNINKAKITKAKLETSIKSDQELDAYFEEYEKYTVKQKMIDRYKVVSQKKDTEEKIESEMACEEHNGYKIYTSEFINELEESEKKIRAKKEKHDSADKAKTNATERVYKLQDKIKKIESVGKTDSDRQKIINEVETTHQSVKTTKSLYLALFIISILLVGTSLTLMFIESIPKLPVYIILGCGGAFALGAIIVLSSYFKKNKLLHKYLGSIECKSYNDFLDVKSYVEHDSTNLNIIIENKNKADDDFKTAKYEFDSSVATANDILTNCRFQIFDDIFETIKKALLECKSKKETINNLEMQKNTYEAKIQLIDIDLKKYSDKELTEFYTKEYDEKLFTSNVYENAKRRKTFLKESIPTLRNQYDEYRQNITYAEARNLDPAAISESLEETKVKLDYYQNKYNAIMCAKDALESASGKLRSGLSPKIADSASKYISTLTQGKYSKILMNQDFEMAYEYNGELHPVETLSAGAGDITYMAMRFALIENLYNKYSPPFIFDESFSRLDEDRLKNLLTLLADLSNSGIQCFIFTCHSREENILKNYTPYIVHHIR